MGSLKEDEKLFINKNITSLLKKYSWLKILRISALNGKGVKNLNTVIYDLQKQLSTRITTHELNILFREIWTKKPPHPFRGRRAKLKICDTVRCLSSFVQFYLKW